MAEYCAVRQCDICKKGVAKKNGLFWETIKTYKKMNFKIEESKEYMVRAILCEDCYNRMVNEIRNRMLEGRDGQ